jgi:magnesium-transporting ATPase (P-type)
MPQLGWAIIAVVVVNGAFSFVQEYRAERATRALAALLPEEATALRDGRKRRGPAAELVPGDVVLLVEGGRVSVDARVLQSDDLKVDNAALTGESEPVPRGVDPPGPVGAADPRPGHRHRPAAGPRPWRRATRAGGDGAATADPIGPFAGPGRARPGVRVPRPGGGDRLAGDAARRAALFLGWHPGTPLPTGGPALATLSTMVFAAIVLAQMANAFECRSTVTSLRALGPATNRLLVGAVAGEFLILLGFVYLGAMQQLVGHQPLTPVQWVAVLAAPMLLVAAEETRKAVARRRRRATAGPIGPEPPGHQTLRRRAAAV